MEVEETIMESVLVAEDSDPLGSSLLEVSTYHTEVLGEDDQHLDPLGTSLIASESNSEDLVDYPEFPSLLLTSTPKKQGCQVPFDAEQFSEVRASPYLMKSKERKATGMKIKALKPSEILKDLKKTCKCGEKCLDRITYRVAFDLRNEYWDKTESERCKWICTKMRNSLKQGRFTYLFLDNGLKCCLCAFRLIMRINKNKLTSSKVKMVPSDRSETRGYSESSVGVIMWLENYASLYGDRMPHTLDILLPYKTRQRNVFHLYKEETSDPVAESTFYQTWRNHFPNLKVKKTNSFSQCTKCASLQKLISTTTSNEMRQQLKKEKDLHNQRQMLERKYYYAKRDVSRNNPEEHLSLIIDGMDQSKTDLPHFTGRQLKNINPAVLLKTHITGVLSHGDNSFRAFLDLLEFPHDPNLTINVLLRTLIEISEKKGKLPEKLYLQMDNCFRENKNKYVFGFCEYLTRKNIFKEVHVSFLYSGHTHEDIDAAFSKISQQLRVQEAETLPQLMSIIPNVTRIMVIYDAKNWIGDHLSKVKNITDPLHFKMTKNGTFYKGQQHCPWQKLDGIGCFLKTMPKGRPQLVTPDFTKIIEGKERLSKQISDIEYLFACNNSKVWWDTFLNGGYAVDDQFESVKWTSQLPTQITKTPEVPRLEVNNCLRQMLDKESAEPRITCEKKRKRPNTSTQEKSKKTKKNQ